MIFMRLTILTLKSIISSENVEIIGCMRLGCDFAIQASLDLILVSISDVRSYLFPSCFVSFILKISTIIVNINILVA